MKTMSRVGVLGCCWVAGLAVSVQGANFVLKPIRSSGSHTIVGNEIRLNGAGQRVFLEVQMQGWTPALLRTYQAKLDAVGGAPGEGYDNGTGVSLAPAVHTCPSNNSAGNAVCAAAFAPNSRCNVPNGPGLKCETGFIDRNRTTPTPFVYPADETDQSGVATGSLNYTYFAIRIGGEVDPGALRYGGDLVLDVPAGAAGSYTISFNAETTSTFMADPDQNDITLSPPIAARITILCATNANCNDNNACTNDICNTGNGTCSNPINYNPATHCCNPTNQALTVLSDGNQCTDDVCNTATGQVTHPNSPALITPCGNPANSQCDHSDSCDGAGGCNARLEPNGTACGSDTDTECNGADTCNGAGVCQTNIRDNTTPCGDPSSGLCDDPDRCNGLGACLANNKPNGVPCSTGQFCIGDERCQSAVCTGGTPTNCADLLTCTTDSCNEGADQCDHPQNAGTCLIDGVCYLPGDLRPGDTCEECNPTLSTTAWSLKPDGSACNDGNACTGTGRPGIGFDTCTGGDCFGTLDPQCNDQCEFAVPAIVGQNLSTNSSAGDDGGTASCQNDTHADVWFEYTANCDGAVFISTTGSNLLPVNDPVLNVFTECPLAGGVEVACDDDSGAGLNAALVFNTTQGEDYFIRVSGFQNNRGTIVMNLSPVGDCLIDGVCYLDGDLNPANDCQACIPEISTTQWSPQPEGSACGNVFDTDCDSPDACDGSGVCEVNYKADGIPCSDEVPAVCDKDLCNTCTKNLCQSGVCTHPPEDAGLACGSQFDDDCDNPNTCNGGGGCANNLEGAGHACGDQTDTQCDNPDICDGFGGCLDNFEIDGVPCDDADICTGDDACVSGFCDGILAIAPPNVEALGSRVLSVTPKAGITAAPVALHVTSPNYPCLDDYIDDNGNLVPPANKVFHLPSEWGTILVQDPDIVPSTTYHIEAECGAYRSDPTIVSTWLWGDMDNNGIVNAIDIVLLVNKLKELPGAISTEIADIHPCVPNGIINALDITVEVMIVKGQTYYCGPPCH